MKATEAAEAANVAFDVVKKAAGGQGRDLFSRVKKRAEDKAWREEARIPDGEDGIFDAACVESAETVAAAFVEKGIDPESLRKECGASELAASPDLVALALRWKDDRRVLVFDGDLESLLRDFPGEATGKLDDLRPGTCFVAWPATLDKKIQIDGFFVSAWDEGEGHLGGKRVVIAAVENGPRRRIVVVDMSDADVEEGCRLALLAEAEVPLRHLAGERPDVGKPAGKNQGPQRTTCCVVGENLAAKARGRRRMNKSGKSFAEGDGR